MPALWEAEGVTEDFAGTGFFRVACVSSSEAQLPDVASAVLGRVVEVRTVRLLHTFGDNYRLQRLPVPSECTHLWDGPKRKRWERLSDGSWHHVRKRAETPGDVHPWAHARDHGEGDLCRCPHPETLHNNTCAACGKQVGGYGESQSVDGEAQRTAAG